MKKNIIFLLDESGSMFHIREETLNSYKEWAEQMGAEANGALFSLFTFNGKVKTVQWREPRPHTIKSYLPNGSTALYDAILRAVFSVPDGENALLIILTDGMENSSRYGAHQGVKTLLDDRIDAGWEVSYVGCEAFPSLPQTTTFIWDKSDTTAPWKTIYTTSTNYLK